MSTLSRAEAPNVEVRWRRPAFEDRRQVRSEHLADERNRPILSQPLTRATDLSGDRTRSTISPPLLPLMIRRTPSRGYA